MSPEIRPKSFGTFEEQAPWPFSRCFLSITRNCDDLMIYAEIISQDVTQFSQVYVELETLDDGFSLQSLKH